MVPASLPELAKPSRTSGKKQAPVIWGLLVNTGANRGGTQDTDFNKGFTKGIIIFIL